MLKWNFFFPIRYNFPKFWGFFKQFLRFADKILGFVPIIDLKQTPLSHGWNAKIGFKNNPTCADILPKNYNWVEVWFGVPCLNTFLQISRPRVFRFSNQFLHWNRGIKTVVSSIMKGTYGISKNLKMLSPKLKNGLKSIKLWEK